MAEASVTIRTRQQGERLRALRERTGISKGRLMDVLGFKTSRAYDLYEDGTSVIRLDRLEDWASAFGVGVLEFVAVVLDQPDPVLRARVVDALGPDADGTPPDQIDEMVRELAKQTPQVREDALAEMWEDTRTDSHDSARTVVNGARTPASGSS